jgi:hypothetical protein
MAAVKVIEYNHIRQLITIEAGKGVTTTAPIPSSRKDPADIMKEMKGNGAYGDFGLDNVGLTLAQAKKATPGKWAGRQKCDCCLFYARGTGPTGCTFANGTTVCDGCLEIFGRPACSWTLGIPSTRAGNTFQDLASLGDTANALIRRALHGLDGSTGESLVVPDPEMLEVEQEDKEVEQEDEDMEQELDAFDAEVWEGP